MREAFVPASRLYDVRSGNRIAHPARQASDDDVRRAVEERTVRTDGGHETNELKRAVATADGRCLYHGHQTTNVETIDGEDVVICPTCYEYYHGRSQDLDTDHETGGESA